MKMIADLNEQLEKPYLYSESRSMQQKSQSLSKNLIYHKNFQILSSKYETENLITRKITILILGDFASIRVRSTT